MNSRQLDSIADGYAREYAASTDAEQLMHIIQGEKESAQTVRKYKAGFIAAYRLFEKDAAFGKWKKEIEPASYEYYIAQIYTP